MMDKSKGNEPDEENSSEDSPLKIKPKNRGRKRKRINSNSSTDLDFVLPENTLEVEKSLHASAVKNNLDDISVKKILKKVVTNDHVLALVKLREEEMDSGTEDGHCPKLTRSKIKELMKVSPRSATWNSIELTPIKHIPVKTRPEVEALIAQELPDDEDDDEYEPTKEEVLSDDDHGLESCSDFESQPRTPATPNKRRKIDIIQDGPFKVPQDFMTTIIKKEEEEEATIALRTRSKLSLSSTSIENIENAFVPPDDIPMPDVDDLWNNFLEECLNPASNARHEEDDEADPEYNVAADPDAHDEDESLENSIIKISKKELNDLVTELFNVLPQGSEEQLANEIDVLGNGNGDMTKPIWDGKQEPMSDEEVNLTIPKVDRETRSIGKMEPEDPEPDEENQETIAQIDVQNIINTAETQKRLDGTPAGTVQISVVEHRSGVQVPPSRPEPPAPLRNLQMRDAPPAEMRVHVNKNLQIFPEQIQILEQQIRQHVQLATTFFLQLFVHPVHWSYAPKYKEYLESLVKLTQLNRRSVANVCNLKSALELVKCWEESVSENTPENVQMVEFVQKEVEKSRRRISQNNIHLGDFPEMFKRVISNSSVVLYPYLLPPSPCRADNVNKKYGYFTSEDELMVLGLDQFSKYIEENPTVYKKPRIHPRKRWSLSTAAELTCKYMFPWMNVRSLLGHVQLVKRTGDKANPIVKYFEDGTVVPYKHKLLPINPSLTLYEQPDFEIPRIWIKYLAQSSKRFKDSLHRKPQTTVQPAGVEVALDIIPQQKQALPIDFTKPIESGRINVLPKTKTTLVNKVDVPIQTQENKPSTVYIAANIYTIMNTSKGKKLMPLQLTHTVNTTKTPICSPVVVNGIPNSSVMLQMDNRNRNVTDTREQMRQKERESHCKCCHLVRKICKTRQSLITDYFNRKNRSNNACGCKNRKYPKITNKLKLLVNNHKTLSLTVYNDLMRRIEICKSGSSDRQDLDNNEKDFADVLKFHIKLIQRTSIARDTRKKVKVNNIFANFNIDEGNPLDLATELQRAFDVELADLYREFLMFLTPKQADEIDNFNYYFITSCLRDLMIKIEDQLKGNKIQEKLLAQLQKDVFENYSACEMCCRLLQYMQDYPDLARYTFELFPHKWKVRDVDDKRLISKVRRYNEHERGICITSQVYATVMSETVKTNKKNDTPRTSDEAPNTVNNESGHSSRNEEEAERTLVEENGSSSNINNDDKLITTIKSEEMETPEMTVPKTEVQESDSSDRSMLVMSDDESIKSEPSEWKRDEDKVVLEVLKHYYTPEQIKDKTIIEIIEEQQLLMMIADNLGKSLENVRERVLYLLQVLGSNV